MLKQSLNNNLDRLQDDDVLIKSIRYVYVVFTSLTTVSMYLCCCYPSSFNAFIADLLDNIISSLHCFSLSLYLYLKHNQPTTVIIEDQMMTVLSTHLQ